MGRGKHSVEDAINITVFKFDCAAAFTLTSNQCLVVPMLDRPLHGCRSTLRVTSFGLLRQLRGLQPLKPKRTLQLRPSFCQPRSSISDYSEKLPWTGFWRASRAPAPRIESVLRATLLVGSIYNRMPFLRITFV
jgi:hypothetical protein